MALHDATRTIYEYLEYMDQTSLADVGLAQSIINQHDLADNSSSNKLKGKGGGGGGGRLNQTPLKLPHRILDLLVSQLRAIYAEKPGGLIGEESTSLMYQQSGPDFALAAMMIFCRFIEKSSDLGGLEIAALIAVTETLCKLAQDHAFQYFIIRRWEDMQPWPGTLQSFFLMHYKRWYGRSLSHAPIDPALYMQLWSILTAQQPLEIQASAFPSLAEVVCEPIHQAAVGGMMNDNSGRRRSTTMEQQSPSSLVFYSLQTLGNALRSSPSFRQYVKDLNSEEKNRISDDLLALVVSMQKEESGTEIVLASLGALVRLCLAGGGGDFEHQIFDRRNVEQMAYLVFSRLLKGLLSSSTKGSSSSSSGTTPSHHRRRSSVTSAIDVSSFSSSTNDMLANNSTPTTATATAQQDIAIAKTSADILSDMLRSQLILNLLERDLEYLPRFISRAVSILSTVEAGTEKKPSSSSSSSSSSTTAQGKAGVAFSYAKYEPLIRALRLICTESEVGQSLFMKHLLEGGVGGSQHQDQTPLARLVEFVLCPHAPTAWEANSLLEYLLQGDTDKGGEGSCRIGSGNHQIKRLWLSLVSVMRGSPAKGSGLCLEVERPDPLGLSPPRMRLRGSGQRDGVAQQQQQQPETYEPPAREAPRKSTATLMEHLISKLQLLAEQLKMGNGLEVDGTTSVRYSCVIDVEWPLRSLLGFTSLICQSKEIGSSLGRHLIEPQAIGAIVIALAHLQAKRSMERLQESGKVVRSTREYMSALAPSFRSGGIGPLDIVVGGCTILLRTMIALRAALMTMKSREVHQPPLPAAPAHGMHHHHHHSRAASLDMETAEGYYVRWTAAVLGTTQVTMMIYMATTQGASRSLTTRALELMTLAQLRGGADFEGIVDSFIQGSQKRDGCTEELVSRCDRSQEQMKEMQTDLMLTHAKLCEQEVWRESVQTRHESAMRVVEESLLEEIKTLRNELKQKDHTAEEQLKQHDQMKLEMEEKLALADARIDEERLKQSMAMKEVDLMRQKMETLKSVMGRLEQDSASSEVRLTSSQQEKEGLKQTLMQKDLERMEAETRLEDALKNTAELEAKLEENYSKLIALAKAYKSKEDTARRSELRLQQLEGQVVSMQEQVEELRESLQEKDTQAKKLQVAVDRRDVEMNGMEEELSQRIEELSRLKMKMEVKENEVDGLERDLRQLRDLLHRREMQLAERDEALSKHKNLAAMINRLTTSSGGIPSPLLEAES